MKRLVVTIIPNLLLRIIYKYTKTLHLFKNYTNRDYLQKLVKMPSYKGLGLMILFVG